jgi:3-isopropylmalate dehydrogenase
MRFSKVSTAKNSTMKSLDSALIGACAIDAAWSSYPDETHATCMKADAVLFGAITQNTITTQQQK